MKGIVFWTSYICMHSSSVFEYVGEKMEVIIACASNEYGTFGSLNLKNIKIYQVKDKADVNHLIELLHFPTEYIHVNGCLKAYPGIEQFGYALRKLLKLKCIVLALNVEQFQWWGGKGLLRRMQWFYLYNIGIGKNIKAIGCTGDSSIEAHQKAFVSRKRLFDFIYTVPSPQSYLLEQVSNSNLPNVANGESGCKFVYVGQIISRKCVIEMVKVFKSLNIVDYSLEIIGGGDKENELIDIIKDNRRIHYWGKIAPSAVRKILLQTDVLIQPSKLEGWGCTVNEGLMMGNRVLISDAVGSRSLINNREWLGTTFRSGNWKDLRTKIIVEIKRGKRSMDEREKIRDWAECIYPEKEADYLIEVINYYMGKSQTKPVAPWI